MFMHTSTSVRLKMLSPIIKVIKTSCLIDMTVGLMNIGQTSPRKNGSVWWFRIGLVYKERGFEGLFIDNADVYCRYHMSEVYQSLKSMLASLKEQGFKLIVNGGDVFVSETLKDGSAKNLYDGINQEDVFTTYDFNKKKYGRQAKKNTDYYERYLKQAKKAGLDVYIVEYRAGRELSKKIDAYCERHGYKWYNADGIKLN